MSEAAFMARALALARAQLGRVAPNPAVGCVLVAPDGSIVGEGATSDGGRPHAEERALDQAAGRARGAAAYVTLEPCGARTSGVLSCADRLIAAGVRLVEAAIPDPHPKADGAGIARLRAQGIEVRLGMLAEEATSLNAGFLLRVRTGRPLLAVDADFSAYDAAFKPLADEPLEAALDRLGAAGLTRVVIAPDTALARAAAAAGLVTCASRDLRST